MNAWEKLHLFMKKMANAWIEWRVFITNWAITKQNGLTILVNSKNRKINKQTNQQQQQQQTYSRSSWGKQEKFVETDKTNRKDPNSYRI